MLFNENVPKPTETPAMAAPSENGETNMYSNIPGGDDEDGEEDDDDLNDDELNDTDEDDTLEDEDDDLIENEDDEDFTGNADLENDITQLDEKDLDE